MKSLVGYTGFVGGNLCAKGDFTNLYNSKNIEEAFGSRPDVLYYAGVPAEKFIANKFPEKDLEIIKNAQRNIEKINPSKLVLISTIDVYENPKGLSEANMPDAVNTYGKDRALLEKWVRENINDYLIVRLPGLFGKGIKKNFIYDYIKYIPSLLNEAKFEELSKKNSELEKYYEINDKGFFECKVKEEDRKVLKNIFKDLGFSALNFTDSRGVYQYYNLNNLYSDIEKALDKRFKILNIATEPVKISEIYSSLTGEIFINEISDTPAEYDMRSEHYKEMNGKNGYLYSKEEILKEIKQFTEEEIIL